MDLLFSLSFLSPPSPPSEYANRELAIERTGWGTAEGAAAQTPPVPRTVGRPWGTGCAAQLPHGTPSSLHKGFGSPVDVCKVLCRPTLTFHIRSNFLSFHSYESSASVFPLSCRRQFLEGI